MGPNFTLKKEINETIFLWKNILKFIVDRVIRDEKSVAKIFKDYFTSLMKHLHMERSESDLKHMKLFNNPAV